MERMHWSLTLTGGAVCGLHPNPAMPMGIIAGRIEKVTCHDCMRIMVNLPNIEGRTA